eukprot:7062823-Lingulodinium_polyedra.AAC.1
MASCWSVTPLLSRATLAPSAPEAARTRPASSARAGGCKGPLKAVRNSTPPGRWQATAAPFSRAERGAEARSRPGCQTPTAAT